jgi:hypothetical protein
LLPILAGLARPVHLEPICIFDLTTWLRAFRSATIIINDPAYLRLTSDAFLADLPVLIRQVQQYVYVCSREVLTCRRHHRDPIVICDPFVSLLLLNVMLP